MLTHVTMYGTHFSACIHRRVRNANPVPLDPIVRKRSLEIIPDRIGFMLVILTWALGPWAQGHMIHKADRLESFPFQIALLDAISLWALGPWALGPIIWGRHFGATFLSRWH